MQKIQRTVRRRRHEGKTDYKARFGFLKSGRARVVVRKTNKHILGQLVESDVAQDRIVLSVSSKDLLEKGWPKELEGSLKSLAACYLTGYLFGKKAKNAKNTILDIGLERNIKKSRLYAFVKGFVDAGGEIAHDPDSLPGEEDFKKNEKTFNLIEKIKGGLN